MYVCMCMRIMGPLAQDPGSAEVAPATTPSGLAAAPLALEDPELDAPVQRWPDPTRIPRGSS